MDKLMPLGEIIDTDAGRVIAGYDSGTTHVYYAQAWALVTFLRHGAGGRCAKAFDRMLRDVADGSLAICVSNATPAAADRAGLSFGTAAFVAYFGCRPEELADEYYDHVVRISEF
jgi:hypothetical protein